MTLIDDYLARTPRSRELFERATAVAAGRLHPDDRLHRAVPAVHRIRGRAARPRRRRQHVPRLPVQLHLAHPRPCPPRGRRRGRGAGAPRVGVRGTDRDWRSSSPRRSGGRVPSIERLRFTSSGTEATMFAIRAARAFTGRPLIAKFERLVPRHARRRDDRDGRRSRGHVGIWSSSCRGATRTAVEARAARSRVASWRRSSSSRSRARAACAPPSPGSSDSSARSRSGTARSSSSTRSSRSGSRPAAPRSDSASGPT